MAITPSQVTGKFRVSGGASMAGSFGSLPAEGELVVVVGWGSNSNAWEAQDCVDNQGNTYSLVAVSRRGTVDLAMWWCVSGPTSGTFTVTLNPRATGSFNGAGAAMSYASDASTVWRPDAIARNNQASGTAVSTGNTATLDVADQVVVAACAIMTNDQGSIAVESVSPAWTQEAEELSFATYCPGEVDSRIVAATTAQSCSWTIDVASQSCSMVVTFTDSVP